MTTEITLRAKTSTSRWSLMCITLAFGTSIVFVTVPPRVLSPFRSTVEEIRSRAARSNVTVHYQPSAWEQFWADSIPLFHLNICAHLLEPTSISKMQSLLELMDEAEHILLQSDPVRPVSAVGQLIASRSDLLSEIRFVDSKGAIVQSYKVEPLVGLLRDPRPLCVQGGSQGFVPAHNDIQRRFVIQDAVAIHKYGRRGRAFMFDIGASKWNDDFGGLGLRYFLNVYRNMGINFDHIYAWEARDVTPDYWTGMPVDIRGRVHLYNMPASAVAGHVDNPWTTLLSMTEPEDYVVVKLDIDTPSVELPLLDQLGTDLTLAARVDDFYFEHHVDVKEMRKYWPDVQGTMVDSYNLFRKLRERGIRAHSWP